jgi:hypothetical protein
MNILTQISENLRSPWIAGNDSKKKALFRWANKKEEQNNRAVEQKITYGGRLEPGGQPFADHSLHPVVGELAGARLMRLLGIGTSNVEFIAGQEARERDPKKYLIKTILGNRLRITFGLEDPQQMVVVSEKIPGAIPVFYLGDFYGVRSSFPPIPGYNTEWEWDHCHLGMWERVRSSVFLGKDQVPDARGFYSDFQPPSDWGSIKEAITWNSDSMLRIHAARLFLGATSAHASNILVDGQANLSSIDMEYCLATTHEDLDRLFDNIIPRTRALEALCPVSELIEFQVAELFDELPEVGWPLGSKKKTVEHYIERLRKWKTLFEMRSRN